MESDELKQLRAEVESLRLENAALKSSQNHTLNTTPALTQHAPPHFPKLALSNPEITRFSRQLLMPDIGVTG